jgi:Cu/Ag efflux protein CusF
MTKEESMNRMLMLIAAAGTAFAAGAAGPVQAQAAPLVTAQAKGGAKTMNEPADAEVRRVDKAAGKVTLRHGELKELDMPPMSMVFEVKDKAMLEPLKPGDKVKFRASDDNGKLTVIELKPAN